MRDAERLFRGDEYKMKSVEIQKRNEKILSEVRGGSFIEDIAEKFGMHTKAVWAVCQINGVPTAGQWKARKAYRQKKMSKEQFAEWIKTQCILIDNGCFLWTGNVNEGGYGRVRFGKALVFVHRLIYEVHHKVSLTKDIYICHKCDTPGCCRIEHLWPGDPALNAADRESKGRNVVKFGEDHAHSILKESDVIDIRQVLSQVTAPRSSIPRILAQKYGVSIDLIYRIRKRELWKHI